MSGNQWNHLFSYDTLVHAISGSVGGMTAMAVFFPLDTIRSRLQIEDNRKSKDTLTMIKELVAEEGIESLYRGLRPVLVSLCASGFVYFYTFHGLRAVFGQNKAKYSPLKDLTLGAIAGVVNVLMTTPLWVINMRLKMQGTIVSEADKHLRKYPHYEGVIDAMTKIYNTEGPSGLWSSTLPSLMLVSNPAIQFMIYEMLKREALVFLKADQLSGTVVFVLGAISKSISTVVTYPLQIVQSKQRYGTDEIKKKPIIEIFKTIVNKQGFNGLYKGMESKLLQTVLTTALMYLFYEKISSTVFQLMRASKRVKSQ
ncbi:peroxisomal membrane protein PMP34-like [Oppia nitens]|uniref:peroxisomal membrane protein PMP34-like n=1 Tax=Oppia nitens TaxID=1686743 RepID=UPI0023DCD6EC|nr:peroxisomal membrane protein PMP34-like [Oppia nitens]